MRVNWVMLLFLFLSSGLHAQTCRVKVTAAAVPGWELLLNNVPVVPPLDSLMPEGVVMWQWHRTGAWSPDGLIADSVVLHCNMLPFSLTEPVQRMKLITFPPGAAVYAGDSLKGDTPFELRASKGMLKLTKNGYAGVTLLADTLGLVTKIQLLPLQASENRRFYNSQLFPYLLGGIALLGSVAAVYKIKADEAYSEYRFSNSDHALSRTRRYDLISGISFTLMQVNFGYLIYQFVTE